MSPLLEQQVEFPGTEEETGPTLRVFRGVRPLIVTPPGMLWAFCGILSCLGFGLLAGLITCEVQGTSVVANSMKFPIAIVSMLCLLSGALAGVCAYFRVGDPSAGDPQKRCYSICRDALILQEPDRRLVLPWHEIEEFERTFNSLVLKTTHHGSLTLRKVAGLLECVLAIIEMVKAERVPKYLQEIARGQTVNFGPLGISERGLSHKGSELAWDEVSKLQLVSINGAIPSLNVKKQGAFFNWCSQNLRTVPNHQVFQELLRQVCPPRLLRPVAQ